MRRPLRQQPHIFSTSPMASNSPGNLFANSPSYLTSGGSPSHLTSCGSPSYLTSGGSPSYLTSGVSPSYLTSGFLRYPVASDSPKNLFAANSPSYSLANSLDISLPTASPSRPMAARVTSLGGRSLQPPPVSLRPSRAQPQTADQLISLHFNLKANHQHQIMMMIINCNGEHNDDNGQDDYDELEQ